MLGVLKSAAALSLMLFSMAAFSFPNAFAQSEKDSGKSVQVKEQPVFVTDRSHYPGRRKSFKVLADGTLVKRSPDGSVFYVKEPAEKLAERLKKEKKEVKSESTGKVI